MYATSASHLNAAEKDDFSPLTQLTGPLAAHGSAAKSADPSRHDAAALQARLIEEFGAEDTAEDGAPAAAISQLAAAEKPSNLRSRLLKSLFGLALVATVGWMPVERLFQVSSVEAVVNARLVTLRAPIDGIIDPNGMALRVGGTVPAGGQLAIVSNARADKAAFNAAGDRRQEAQNDLDALLAKRGSLGRISAALELRVSSFHGNRMLLIQARIAEAEAALESAEAIERRAVDAFESKSKLKKKDLVATAALKDTTRDLEVAKAATGEARARKAALLIEENALRSGAFFGDNYNDRPESGQQADELAQKIAILDAEIAGQKRRLANAISVLDRETKALSEAAEARLVAPVGGRVWEILAAPGEHVVAGQEIASLVNCSEALVTATVSESVYNSLAVGMPASFNLREGGATLAGRVIQLSGVASPSSNFAIMPSALTKESYRVAVSLQGTLADGACVVGRTGRVVFNGAAQ